MAGKKSDCREILGLDSIRDVRFFRTFYYEKLKRLYIIEIKLLNLNVNFLTCSPF